MKTINLQSSMGFRLSVVMIIVLLLLIPIGMVRSLIREREMRRDEVVSEVSEKWGGQQQVTGPILTIPFYSTYHDLKGAAHKERQLLHVLPDYLKIESRQNTEVRYRGIYEVVVYSTDLKFKGKFPQLDTLEFNIPAEDILWDETYMTLGISEVKGIRERIQLKWNDQEYAALQGSEDQDIAASGIHFKVDYENQEMNNGFSFGLKLQGSDMLSFVPLGRETIIHVHSDWPHPSFFGQFLPDSRNITEEGYDAAWRVLDYNLNYPRYWVDQKYDLSNSGLGVACHVPVDEYQQTMRTSKYAFMFICLTFVAFIMIELLGKQQLHPIQYLLVGLGLVLFYSILLALTEHVRFGLAYAFAALSMILLISLYMRNAYSHKLFSGITAGVLTTLYGYLYIVLLIQDYALLIGNIGLFIILALVMFLTRKMDWFRISKAEKVNDHS